MGAPRAVLETEAFDVVTEFGKGRRCRRASQAAAHDEDVEFAFVRRVGQLQIEFMLVPLLSDWAAGNL